MDLSEMLEKLQTITGEQNEDVLKVYLDIAGDVILRRLYPYGTEITQVPSPYEVRQIEKAHAENGVNRTYGDSYVPPSYLRGIVPFARVPNEDTEA